MKKNANYSVVTISQRAAENKSSRGTDIGNICLINPLSVRSGSKRLNLTHENSRCSFLATVVKNTTLSSRQMPAIVIRGCVVKREPEPIIKATLTENRTLLRAIKFLKAFK